MWLQVNDPNDLSNKNRTSAWIRAVDCSIILKSLLFNRRSMLLVLLLYLSTWKNLMMKVAWIMLQSTFLWMKKRLKKHLQSHFTSEFHRSILKTHNFSYSLTKSFNLGKIVLEDRVSIFEIVSPNTTSADKLKFCERSRRWNKIDFDRNRTLSRMI